MNRTTLLRKLGYGDPLVTEAALVVLVAAGLTSHRKTGIAEEKASRVLTALKSSLVRVCDRCGAFPQSDSRRRVSVEDRVHCDVCLGSTNRFAIQRAATACRIAGISRAVVVGGAPAVHRELKSLWPEDIELRIVPGTDRHVGQEAKANLDWAQMVVIWASTQLDHKVSRLYTDAPSPKVFVVNRRSIQALADGITKHLGR